MEAFHLEKDLHLFGLQVVTFPIGIGEAFDKLLALFGTPDRSFYGISWMEGDRVIYYAMAPEQYAGEGRQYKLTEITIGKGNYLATTVNAWQQKTDSIKDVFHELMQSKDVDLTTPCVEWYKSKDEMLCMIKTLTEKTKKTINPS